MQLISTNVLVPAIPPGDSTNVLAKFLAQMRGMSIGIYTQAIVVVQMY